MKLFKGCAPVADLIAPKGKGEFGRAATILMRFLKGGVAGVRKLELVLKTIFPFQFYEELFFLEQRFIIKIWRKFIFKILHVVKCQGN